MSVNLSTIETLMRQLLSDYSQSMIPGDIFTYENSSVFSLTEPNVINASTVLKNDVELGSGEWSYSSTTNKVTVSASLTSGDTIEIQYTYYPNYSSTELQNDIKAAISHISANNYHTWIIQNDTIYPEPEEREKHLIAMVASLIRYPDNKTYSLPDMRIVVPRDLPLHQKIAKTIAIFKNNTGGIFELL